MEVKTNNEGNRYIEQDRLGGDKMEITYMPNRKWPDHDVVQDVVRMRLKKASGGYKFGVEIPIDDVPEFVTAIVRLLSERAKTGE